MYRVVYNLCSLKFEHAQRMLYEKYTESIRDYLKENIIPELRQLRGPELLIRLNKKW